MCFRIEEVDLIYLHAHLSALYHTNFATSRVKDECTILILSAASQVLWSLSWNHTTAHCQDWSIIHIPGHRWEWDTLVVHRHNIFCWFYVMNIIVPSPSLQMASILFLDSPVGSSFSYARDPKAYEVGDISSSRQVLTFLRKVNTQQRWRLTQMRFFLKKNICLFECVIKCFRLCSGLMITQNTFWIVLSILVEIHMRGRWFL